MTDSLKIQATFTYSIEERVARLIEEKGPDAVEAFLKDGDYYLSVEPNILENFGEYSQDVALSMKYFMEDIQATELYNVYGLEGVLEVAGTAIDIDKGGSFDPYVLESFVTEFEGIGVYEPQELVSYLGSLAGLGQMTGAIDILPTLAVFFDFDSEKIQTYAEKLYYICEKYKDKSPPLNGQDIDATRNIFLASPNLIGAAMNENKGNIDTAADNALKKFDSLMKEFVRSKVGGGEEAKSGYYKFVFDDRIFAEFATDEEIRNKIYDIAKLIDDDMKYISENLVYLAYEYIDEYSGDEKKAIHNMCSDLAIGYKAINKLLASNASPPARAAVYEAVFGISMANLKRAKDTIESLSKEGFSASEIVELISLGKDIDPCADSIVFIEEALKILKLLDVRVDTKDFKKMVREVIWTKMKYSILEHGANILNLLCKDAHIKSNIFKKYGGAAFQLLYFLHNSWRAEMKNANSPKLKYEDAIRQWIGREGVKNRHALLAKIINLCRRSFYKHGIRYWGRYSLNTLKAIAAGETERESALMITTKNADDSGAFYDIYIDMELLLRRGFGLVVLETDKEDDIYNLLDNRLSQSQWKNLPLFASMDISGHGFPDITKLGKGSGEEYTIDCSDDEWRKYTPLFKAGARISFDSCFMGEELLGCFKDFFAEIPCANFSGGLGLITSELKEDPKTATIFREYNNGYADSYKEISLGCASKF